MWRVVALKVSESVGLLEVLLLQTGVGDLDRLCRLIRVRTEGC